MFHGLLIGNCGYTKETAEKAIAEGHAELISFGRPFISNPDLVDRFRNGWPLAEPAPMSDWYSPCRTQASRHDDVDVCEQQCFLTIGLVAEEYPIRPTSRTWSGRSWQSRAARAPK